MLFSLFYSCKELPPAEEFDPSNTHLHVVWKKPFYADSSQVVMLSPIVTDRYVALTGTSYSKHENHIVVYDKTNGERPIVWQNGVNCETKNNITDFLVGGNNKDILLCATQNSLHAFSIPTGQSLWNVETTTFFVGHPSILGNDIIHITSSIDRYNSSTGEKTSLFSFNKGINTMQWAVNSQKDTVFFFLWGNNDAYCYNLTKNSVVWKNDTLNNGHFGTATSFHPIIVENKYVLFQHKMKISCLDFSTGELIWEKTTGSTNSCPIFYSEGKIIVRPDKYEDLMSCYDVKTGNLLWENTDLKLSDDKDLKMDTYKGNLYFITRRGTAYDCPGFLLCISLATGVVNWFDPGPDKGIYENLTIDQQTGFLYCHSRWSVLCIDLNKTPKK